MEKNGNNDIYENKKYYCNKLNNNFCNNINLKKEAPLRNLFEVENFLCNLKNFKKSINIYKSFKK